MTARMTLPSRLDTGTADALAEGLRALEAGPVTLDGSQVEFLGGLCLEALLLARHERTADGAILTIDGATDAFCDGLKTFGLSETEFTSGDD